MAKASIVLKAALGEHQSPDGKVRIDQPRADHWIAQFHKMKRKGIRVPLPWGHQPKANPAEIATANADEEYWRSRYNAGHVEDIRKDAKGRLEFVVNAPALQVKDGYLIDPQTGTAISEVSPAICDWPDGKGTIWRDSIRHVALCTLPVVHDQDGFRESKLALVANGEIRLSLAVASVRLATEKDKVMPKPMPMLDDDATMDDEGEEEEGAAGGGGADDTDAKIAELKTDLAKLGVHLGDVDMSDPGHFLDVLCAAIKTHHGTKDMAEGEEEGEEEGEAAAPAGTATPTEENPPMLMSLSQASRKLQALEKVYTGEKRSSQIAEITHLRDLGVIPRKTADAMLAEAKTVRLSLQDNGKFKETRLDVQLSVWRQAARQRPNLMDSLAAAGSSGHELMSLGGHEEPQPTENDPKEQQSVIEELAKMAGAV